NGAAYVFGREGTGEWRTTQRLTPSLPPSSFRGDGFGGALAGRDGVLFVGSDTYGGVESQHNGAFYRFEKRDGTWTLGADGATKGPTYAGLGAAIAISGREVLVGADNVTHAFYTKAGQVYRYGF